MYSSAHVINNEKAWIPVFWLQIEYCEFPIHTQTNLNNFLYWKMGLMLVIKILKIILFGVKSTNTH